MEDVILVYMISALANENEKPNIMFHHRDGLPIPNVGEFVYFGSPAVKFQIESREFMYQTDNLLRIIYWLNRPQAVIPRIQEFIEADLTSLDDI